MSTHSLLTSLFKYKAWADSGLIAGLTEIGPGQRSSEYFTALRILNHANIVDCIFAANLQRVKHSYSNTGTDEVPNPVVLFTKIGETDQWYSEYVARLGGKDFGAVIDFAFTDGTAGRMSREEMLGHVISHGGYHRGEVGRILTQLTASSPRDTFTGYLHEVEPARRIRSNAEDLA